MFINNTRFLNETWFYTLPFRGQIILALKILYPINRSPKEHFVMTEIYDCIIKTYQKKRWSKFSRLSKNWCLARALPRFTMKFFFLFVYSVHFHQNQTTLLKPIIIIMVFQSLKDEKTVLKDE